MNQIINPSLKNKKCKSSEINSPTHQPITLSLLIQKPSFIKNKSIFSQKNVPNISKNPNSSWPNINIYLPFKNKMSSNSIKSSILTQKYTGQNQQSNSSQKRFKKNINYSTSKDVNWPPLLIKYLQQQSYLQNKQINLKLIFAQKQIMIKNYKYLNSLLLNFCINLANCGN